MVEDWLGLLGVRGRVRVRVVLDSLATLRSWWRMGLGCWACRCAMPRAMPVSSASCATCLGLRLASGSGLELG
jgi:hypothetical protein